MSQPLTLRTDAGDEHLDISEFEARVRRGEISPQSMVRLPAITGEQFVPACELEVFKALHETRRAYFAPAFRLSRFPFLTSAIILLNLAIYLSTVRAGPLSLDDMVRYGAKADPMVTDLGELWRLFTANFLHRDALHIGLNMFVLFNVGGALENTYRTLDYLWLLVFSGVATMSASLWLSDAVSLGASGMVYGISVPVPRAWRRGADRFGTIAWNNGLPDMGRASFAAQAIEMPEGADAVVQAARFTEVTRTMPGHSPEVMSASVDAPQPSRI